MTAPNGIQKPAQRVELRENIHQRDESENAADRRAGETQDAFLQTRAHRRERANDASNDRGVYSRISRQRENEIADKAGERAFDGKVKVFGIGEGIGREKSAFVLAGRRLQLCRQFPSRKGERHQLGGAFHFRERRQRS